MSRRISCIQVSDHAVERFLTRVMRVPEKLLEVSEVDITSYKKMLYNDIIDRVKLIREEQRVLLSFGGWAVLMNGIVVTVLTPNPNYRKKNTYRGKKDRREHVRKRDSRKGSLEQEQEALPYMW